MKTSNIKLLILLICTMFINALHAQDPCGCDHPEPLPEPETTGICDPDTNGDFATFMNPVSYIPYADERLLIPTPEKMINVSFHIFQRDDGSGNLQNTPEDIAKLHETLATANLLFRKGDPSHPFLDPLDELPYEKHSQIQFTLGEVGNERIFFHQDDLAACGPTTNTFTFIATADPLFYDHITVVFRAATLDNYGEVREENIVITNPGSGYQATPTVTFDPPGAEGTAIIENGVVTGINIEKTGSYSGCDPPEITFVGGNPTISAEAYVKYLTGGPAGMASSPMNTRFKYLDYDPIKNRYRSWVTLFGMASVSEQYSSWSHGGTLAHEFGHVFGLGHTYDNTAPCNTENIDYLDDVFQCPSHCPHECDWGAALDPQIYDITNNLMGGNKAARYISPKQAGIMHRALALTFARRIVHEDSYTPTPYMVSGQELWDFDIKVYHDIVIPHGAELEITCRVVMPWAGRIIVKPGGKLIVNGGIITTDAKNKLWRGIEVNGNPGLSQYPQSNQGVVILLNNAIIENASLGILVDKREVERNGEQIPAYIYGGGIVLAENSEFRNNKVSVHFSPYDQDNISTFTNCTFNYDKILNDSEQQDYHMKFYSVKNINIEVCTFNSDLSLPYQAGNGIYSYNSGINIHGTHTRFRNLVKGVHATSNNSLNTVDIRDARFTSCQSSILLSGLVNPKVISTWFLVPPECAVVPAATGLILQSCSYYQVEGNRFYGETQGHLAAKGYLGTYVKNSGTMSNLIYDNEFTNLSYGILAHGNNRGKGQGLQIRCNDFTDVDYDVIVTPSDPPADGDGIAPLQGNPGILPTDPAGNTFTKATYQGLAWNYYNLVSDTITYYHHNAASTEEKVEPFPVQNVGPVFNHLAQYINKGTSCPPNISNNYTELYTMMLASEDSANMFNSQLQALLDGGDTEQLTTSVATSFPGDELLIRQLLLDESPYLSDTVMATAITKEEVLNNAMIRDVLVANPHAAKSENLLNALDNRFTPMPGYMLDEILEGADITGPKEILEKTVLSFENKRAAAQSGLVRLLLDNRENGFVDSLHNLIFTEMYPAAHYLLATARMSMSDTLSALNLLNNIPNSFTLDARQQNVQNAMIALSGINAALNTDTTFLQPDSAQVNTLFDIFDQKLGLAGIYAQNFLIAAGLLEYEADIEIPEMLKFMPVFQKEKRMAPEGPAYIKVFPNPARSYITAEYKLDAEPSNAQILVIAADGRMIRQVHLKNSQDQVVIELQNLPAGIYFIRLINNLKMLGTAKFNIL